ncbi:MAG: hypothetical protein BJ554DRAFT_4571 [Olpidium bornovanus]|uniref:Uncharacterized protein n=1 Tax=Olpidium bornovanus TaxID=278681 RepID=A0A8H8A204_9FUNG|nr:MAG: hypothetical protein BJ554DRAFT_4571 [Olpidium bornovanus]
MRRFVARVSEVGFFDRPADVTCLPIPLLTPTQPLKVDREPGTKDFCVLRGITGSDSWPGRCRAVYEVWIRVENILGHGTET